MGLGLLLSVGFLLRNPLLTSLVRTQLERMTGGEIRVVGARFEGLASVLIDEVEVRAPGWDGPAGECVLVEGLEAKLRPTSLLQGGFGFDSITVRHVRIRIAEDADDPTRLNVFTLGPVSDESTEEDPQDGDDAPSMDGIGTIVVDRLDIESGIDEGDTWDPSSVGTYFALIEPLDPEGRLHEFTLASLDGDATDALAKGTLDARSGGFALRTNDIDLQRGSTLVLSASAHAYVDALKIGGTIREATVEWRPGSPPAARLRVDGLSFQLPEEAELTSQWVRFEEGAILEGPPPLPRLRLDHGIIELSGDLLSVRGDGGRMLRDLEPEALPTTTVSASFRARLASGEQPEGASFADWGDALLRSTPFELELEIDRFVQPEDMAGRPVDLPKPVAEALELLNARSWDLTATATVQRGELDGASDDRTIHSSARLDLADGRGMYREFRYPLHAVRATIEVDDDQLFVRHLVGLGPSDHEVTLSGRIDGLGDDAGVDLRLASENIGLDDDLLAALPDSTRRGLRTLFDPLAAERLAAAGLLPDAASIESDRLRIPAIAAALAEAAAVDDRATESVLEAELARCRTRVANGPFRLGGGGAIDLRIHRPRIEGHPVAVEGPIDLRSVGGVFSRFPYPLFVERGRIVLEDLAVILDPPGLEIATVEGGRGVITGRVDLPRDGEGGRDVLPELELRVRGDALGPCLFAAIPPDVEERPSPASIPGWPGEVRAEAIEPIVDMGLAGIIDYTVRISTDDLGDARFLVMGQLRGGTAAPRAVTARTVAEAGLVWPRDFTLVDVRAAVEIDDDGIELVSFTGRRGAGSVQARGTYDFATERGRGIARLRDLEIEEYLLDLVPTDSVDDARVLWDRWRPTGRVHADLHWNHRDGRSSLDLEAEPQWAEFDTAVGRTRVVAQRGRLRFGDDAIEVDDMAMTFGLDGHGDGALRLSGRYGYRDTPGVERLDGVLDFGRFEAPAIDEVLHLLAGEDFASGWRDRAPEGAFDGRFTLLTGDSSGFEATFLPTSFSLLAIAGDPESRGGGRVEGDGLVRIVDRRVAIGPLELVSDSGARLGLELRIDDVERPEVAARYRIELPDTEVPELGFVPPPFSSLLEAEGVEAERLEIVGELVARFGEGSDDPADPDVPAFYRTTGTLNLADLTWIIAGTPLETGAPRRPIELELEAVDGAPTWFTLEAELPTVRVAGRHVRNVRLRGDLAGPRSTMPGGIHLRTLEGRLGDGEVRVDAIFDPESSDYSVAIDVLDVPLDELSLVEDDDLPATTVATSSSRLPGRLRARVQIEGDADDPATRIGRGRVELREARLADGGAMALLQIGQLMPPIADELASAEARIWIDGSLAKLTDIRIDAETLRLEGAGTIRLEDWEWSVRLLTRGSLPAFSDLVSAISGTLGAIDISGTPDAPRVSLTPLPMVMPPPGWTSPAPLGADTVVGPPAAIDAAVRPETRP